MEKPKKIILYKTDTCPKCNNVMVPKLEKSGLEYEVCKDIDVMRRKGILSVPVLEVDGELYNFTNAVKFVNDFIYMKEGTNA